MGRVKQHKQKNRPAGQQATPAPSRTLADFLPSTPLTPDPRWLQWYGDWPAEGDRPIRQGGGFTVGMPLVLDLLEAAAAGTADPAAIRRELLGLAEQAYGAWDCYRHDTRENIDSWCTEQGGCSLCAELRPHFERALTESVEAFRRYLAPEDYPFVAGAGTLHDTGCPVARINMPKEFKPPAGELFERILSGYAHGDPEDPDWHTFEYRLRDAGLIITWSVMTAAEARAWINERTGPRGGRHYHRCKRCVPTP